ncbi:MAG: hypothetical protein IPL54_17000 [Chitinophagaceae bacterium]|nr:hypothetical protein [Chitinophagaceae bacterium]
MPISLASIITHYRKFKNANPDLWIQHCINQNTIKSAIYFAALSENQFGKRHKHQYRLESKSMILFKDRLLANHKMIQRAINFDNLLQIIAAQRIHGIGDLAVYDTAIRIGAFLD